VAVKNLIAFLTVLVLLSSSAQVNGQAAPERRFEITPYAGYVWSRGYDVLLGNQRGNLNTEAGAMWGVAVSYSLSDELTRIEVLYNRQDTEMTAEFGGDKTAIDDVSIDYLQAGGLFGVERKNAVWFTSLSLGTTRLRIAPAGGRGSDEWRFSIIFGLGAKRYFNDRIGLRAQVRAPYMYVEDTAAFICDEAGCLKSAGGRGIWQFDLSLGLMIRL
jgi:hypothetical protein